jgi:hypothetical protein
MALIGFIIKASFLHIESSDKIISAEGLITSAENETVSRQE